MPPDEIMGLDTVDLEDPQGNWLFKRVWWERAEQKYEKIRALVTQIMEQRSGFFTKRSELDKNVLDPFYIEIGFKQGELKQKVDDLIADIKNEKNRNSSDTEYFEKLQNNKKELESLSTDIEKVTKQDQAVERAIMQLVDQINKLHNYEQQAWQDFKDIARVLDDKKARELFYKVDNAWQNVQKVQEYIEKTFTGSFDTLIQDISKQITRIKDQIDALKEQGIVLYKQVTGHGDADNEEGQESEQKESSSRGWIESLVDMMRKAVNATISLIRWPYDLIMGKSTQEQPEVQMDDELEGSVEAQGAAETQAPTDKQMPEPSPAYVNEQEATPSQEEHTQESTAPQEPSSENESEMQEPDQEENIQLPKTPPAYANEPMPSQSEEPEVNEQEMGTEDQEPAHEDEHQVDEQENANPVENE